MENTVQRTSGINMKKLFHYIYEKCTCIVCDNAANMVNFDFALISFEKEQTSFDDESESDGEDNCDDDMSKLCDKMFPKHPC